jgi:hypothetical protein
VLIRFNRKTPISCSQQTKIQTIVVLPAHVSLCQKISGTVVHSVHSALFTFPENLEREPLRRCDAGMAEQFYRRDDDPHNKM